MKNHFFIGYAGNKRNETENIYNIISEKLKGKKIIIEPFCGTSALSYYISLKEPKKYKYILNDLDKNLIELYEIARDKKRLKILIEKLNKLIIGIDKEKYKNIIKQDTLEAYIIKRKIYSIRPGLFPDGNRKIIDNFNFMEECPIINFLRTENITFKNKESIKLIEKYGNNEDCFIFMDPPYLKSCNDFYDCKDINIYEYLYNNKINNYKSYIILCLEDNWIIKLLFKKYIIDSYSKTYQATKKQTTHIIISNDI